MVGETSYSDCRAFGRVREAPLTSPTKLTLVSTLPILFLRSKGTWWNWYTHTFEGRGPQGLVGSTPTVPIEDG